MGGNNRREMSIFNNMGADLCFFQWFSHFFNHPSGLCLEAVFGEGFDARFD
jgi:hypothetical protein